MQEDICVLLCKHIWFECCLHSVERFNKARECGENQGKCPRRWKRLPYTTKSCMTSLGKLSLLLAAG